MDLYQDLNPQQREAVLHEGGPLLLLAGAGSGKTRALTYRIVHLINSRNIAPWNILAITFTNKAAEEMRLRTHRLIGSAGSGIWIGTFHATCARILRKHIERLGFKKNFVIYDDADQLRVIKSCLKSFPDNDNRVRPIAVRSILDKAKNQGADPVLLIPDDSVVRDRLEKVIIRYERFMHEANALDFGDLILFVLRLFERFPEVLSLYQQRFHSVLVDEYQDTNRVQHLLIKKLMPDQGDLCVVGDDDQSIYRWRGAEVNNLLDFEKDFPGTRILTLEQNYRSTQNILNAAGAVARANPQRREKNLWTNNEIGERIGYSEAETPEEEAQYIAQEIKALVADNQVPFNDIGIFFRTNAQSRSFEEQFAMHRIPHVVIGSIRFYERAEIKDALAYLQFLYNSKDSISLLRILNRPARGIGAVSQGKLEAYAAIEGLSLWDAIAGAMQTNVLSASITRKLKRFQDLILQFQIEIEKDISLTQLLKNILEQTGYIDFLEAQEDSERRLENIEELMRTAAHFERSCEEPATKDRLGIFLERISLVTDLDQYEDKANCVSLMTLHLAKGLEFSTVFLTGLENGILPHQRSLASPGSLAEERRLCYVGMTRAKKRLYLSRAYSRSVYGEWKETEPSMFLASIPGDLMKFQGNEESFKPRGQGDEALHDDSDSFLDYSDSQLDLPVLPKKLPANDRKQLFRVGDMVEHDSLGWGTVRRVEGRGDKEKITVHFLSGGIRKLMVQLSPIKKLPT